MVDENANGASDIWEKNHNDGQLFTAYDPTADPDGDGWTNAREAIAGTDPFNKVPQNRFPLAEVTHVPAVYGTDENGDLLLQTPEGFIILWNTEIGKQYTLQGSSDLSTESWFSVNEPMTALNSEIKLGISPIYSDGSTPPALFWRATVNDVDSDGDGFTDYEEYYLRTDSEIADSDADGLPDLWETFYGLDPHDGGTINPDNGASGDPDHDGFTNEAEFAGISSPKDNVSLPIGQGPGNGAGSQSVGAPPSILSSCTAAFGYKYGFQGFQTSGRKYLTREYSLTSTDGSGGGGSTVETEYINFQTGELTYNPPVTTGSGGTDNGGEMTTLSDDFRSRNGTGSGGTGSFTSTETLSNEYTTALFTAYVESTLTPYPDSYTNIPKTAYISLMPQPLESAEWYSVSKVKYKWEVHKESVYGEIVNWLEIFTPDDESTPVVEPKTWANYQGIGNSPIYEIDPTLRNSRKNGFYAVVPAEFELRHDTDVILGWDSTKREDCLSVGVGKTTTIASLWLQNIGEEVAGELELVVDKASQGYITLQNHTITDPLTEFDVTGIKATSALGCKIILRRKGKNETIATLRVNVFDKIDVKVAIYTVHDGRQLNTDVGDITNLNQNIESKLNEVYGPQANLNFTVEAILSKDLNMGVNANDPVLFNPDGKFNYDTYRQDVVSRADTPAKVLPIFIVKELLDPTKIGVTNEGMTECFVNNIAGCDVTSAHEVGHYYNLSREKKGQADAHDMGPWPQELIDGFGTAKTGLLHETGGVTQSGWLRQRDWVEANTKAKSKSN